MEGLNVYCVFEFCVLGSGTFLAAYDFIKYYHIISYSFALNEEEYFLCSLFTASMAPGI